MSKALLSLAPPEVAQNLLLSLLPFPTCPGQADRDIPECSARNQFPAPWCPLENLSLAFSKLKGWGSQGRAGWQCPGCAQAPRAVSPWGTALRSAGLQTLLSSLNLQPWTEAKLAWMSLVIKVFYLPTPWQFVPVWCMRKGPFGAKPLVKCVLKLNLKPWMWMFHNLSWISIERTIVCFWWWPNSTNSIMN